MADEKEPLPAECLHEFFPDFLRELAERLRYVPGTDIIDDGDIDQLIYIARRLEKIDDYVREGLSTINNDERHHYKPALVQINAPLALEQVNMKARKFVFEGVRDILAGED